MPNMTICEHQGIELNAYRSLGRTLSVATCMHAKSQRRINIEACERVLIFEPRIKRGTRTRTRRVNSRLCALSFKIPRRN